MTAVIRPCAVRDSQVTKKKLAASSFGQNPAYWQRLEILEILLGRSKNPIFANSRIYFEWCANSPWYVAS
jgi:hypothetical protein